MTIQIQKENKGHFEISTKIFNTGQGPKDKAYLEVITHIHDCPLDGK